MKTRVTLLLTTPRSVTGVFDHGDQRMSDALNRPLESAVRLSEATLGRIGNPAANEPVSFAVVPKSQIALVYAEREQHAATERRISSFVPKRSTELIVLLAGLRVRGDLHASAALEPAELQRLVTDAGDRFVVLTEARLALDVEGVSERPIGVALLSVRHIQFVARIDVRADQPDPRLVLLDRV